MKIKDSKDEMVEVGEVKGCPICNRKDKLEITAKQTYDELVAEHGSSLVSIECKRCGIEMRQYYIDNNNYYFGLGKLMQRWNTRNGEVTDA